MSTKNNITLLVDLYSEREMKKQAISFHIKKHYPILYSEIMSIINGASFLINAYCYINQIYENPKCHCGSNTTFISMSKGFSKTCSYKCMGLVDVTKTKRKYTTLKKYGFENISVPTRHIVAEKLKNKTDTEKKSIDEKKKIAYLKNHGVNNPNKSKLIRNKTKKTNLEKYGVEYPTQASEIVDLRRSNNLEKYGVISPTQLPEIYEKSVKSNYRRKEYVWKTGQVSIVQGYEPLVLKELEDLGYSFDQVKTKATDMPKFSYIHKNKTKRYFPDIFIPKDNIVIEVKSDYTVVCNTEINSLKFQSVVDAGYEFRLEVR